MIRKFVAARHSDAARLAVRSNHVNAGEFRFLAAVTGVWRDVERIAVSTQNRARAFVKPLRSGPIAPGAGRPPSIPERNIFMLSVRSASVDGVHTLAAASTAHMGQSSSRNQAARRFRGMVNGRQNSPLRPPVVDRIIFEQLARGPFPSQIAELHAVADGGAGQFVDRAAAVKQPQIRLLDQSYPPRIAALELNQSRHETSFDDFELFQRCFVDRQAQPRNVLVQINETVFGFGLAVEDVPE